MAEAFTNRLGKGRVVAESAGIEPGRLNPDVVQVMKEVGYDLSCHHPKSVESLFREGRRYQTLVAVCSKEAAERCPIFPGVATRLHWPFDDPAAISGTEEERLEAIRAIRDQICSAVEAWLTGLR